MNSYNKYLILFLLVIGSYVTFISLVATFFFILKLCAITLDYTPGFAGLFKYGVTIFPYFIFFAGYYALRENVQLCKSKIAKTVGALFYSTGLLCCIVALIITNLVFFKIRGELIQLINDYSQYFLIIQLGFIFLTTISLASGDEEEKDWMEKH
ncbi:MAG: hypothetical protein HY305_04105 [Sphingobacteriales bacterium]|nr:hypothetical protein [Sphingobacteriales bacterium]